jgi:hypothetical protein
MYLRKVERHYKDKLYVHYLLVQSVYTPKGPRQKIICSLGDLKPKPITAWLALLQDAVAALEKVDIDKDKSEVRLRSHG